ncbi:hypothetical protein CYMTET_13023 [Cymbomonas tetramitiformis]|uniref:LITAF domain-containing protein n=1 Tax=Cymbomonas tetramitiformis TaxID=36881 RepID=A0AAE0GJD7_9CHLO|nr:hypothetical protein CYMTET_13023 [Cymbomonas tetramitiformis]
MSQPEGYVVATPATGTQPPPQGYVVATPAPAMGYSAPAMGYSAPQMGYTAPQPGVHPPYAPVAHPVHDPYASGQAGAPLGLPPDGSVYLGATRGHDPFAFTCPQCSFQGLTKIKKKAGWAYGMGAMLTFGISMVAGAFKDTYHHCPRV